MLTESTINEMFREYKVLGKTKRDALGDIMQVNNLHLKAEALGR